MTEHRKALEETWLTEAGYPAVITMDMEMEFRCGYVGVPPSHPLYGKGYSHDDAEDIEVHGGLTYADELPEHLVEGVDPPGLWWFGFDCAHLGDKVTYPYVSDKMSGVLDGVRRSNAYVKAQCESLAQQLLERQGLLEQD